MTLPPPGLVSRSETATADFFTASQPAGNDLESNPTITTLSRYAEALGKTLVVTLVDSNR